MNLRSGKLSSTDAVRTGRHLCRKPDLFIWSLQISVSCHTARNAATSVVDWLRPIPPRSVVPYPPRARLITVSTPQPLRPFCMRTEKMNLFISSLQTYRVVSTSQQCNEQQIGWLEVHSRVCTDVSYLVHDNLPIARIQHRPGMTRESTISSYSRCC